MQLDNDQLSTLEWAFKGLVGIIFSIGWWLWSRLVATVVQTKEELSAHKLDISERYAKKEDLRPIYDTLKDMQGDIKELLGRKRAE